MNLLKETIYVLRKHKHSLRDIRFLTEQPPAYADNKKPKYVKVTEEDLIKCLDIEYDNGFGCVEINDNLVLVGDTFWLERHTYDGSEWWEYKEIPEYENENEVTIDKIKFTNTVYGFSRRGK